MIGSVQIIETFGTEQTLVETARVCTGVETELSDSSLEKNIQRLIRDKHWSVFDHASIRITIDAPIYVMRQWMRHHGAWMEKSRRYTSDTPKFGEILGKQADDIIDTYESDLQIGNKPEDARKELPLDLMTTVRWTPTLRTLFHFFRLRVDTHAQKEIRDLAEELLVQTYKFYPKTVESFLLYDLGDFSLGVDTLFDLYFLTSHGAYAYEGSEKRINAWGENAKKRLELVQGIFERLDQRDGDSTESGGQSGSTRPNDTKVSEEVRVEHKTGTETRSNTAVDNLRDLARREQTTSSTVSKEDSGDKQLYLFDGEELPVPSEEGSKEVDTAEAVGTDRQSNIVEGHFGVLHT